MTVLLTNDDGISCEGLQALRRALEPDHEVWVLAPDSERSGISHAMSLKTPCRVKHAGGRNYTCSGMPADCVILTHLGVLPCKPDVVISGINRGPNLGTDLVYSGTAAAARQASIMGWKGIAVSLATYQEPFHFEPAAFYIRDHLEELARLWSPDVFINVNIPSREESCTDWVFATPSRRTYHDSLKKFDGPDSYSYCFLTDGRIETVQDDPESDWHAVERGLVAVSRIVIQPQSANGAMQGRA